MSRGEELREKFRKKAEEQKERMNSPYEQFKSALFNFLSSQYKIPITNDEFTKKQFECYEISGSPEKQIWFAKNLKDCFQFENDPPKWICEPTWCYHEGKPLVFKFQNTDGDGITYYIFEGTYHKEGGKRAFYKMICQDKEGLIHLNGIIEG